MQSYLNLLRDVMENGEMVGNRTGIRTKMVVGREFRHDMRTGFPLLTTKKINPNTVFTELEGFIKGITDKKWYQVRKCFIWDEWCNPQIIKKYNIDDTLTESKYLIKPITQLINKIIYEPSLSHKVMPSMHELLQFIGASIDGNILKFNDSMNNVDYKILKDKVIKLIQLYETDLGAIYGYQYSHFGAVYPPIHPKSAHCSSHQQINGINQLQNLIDTMKNNPLDRRMVVLAWNPVDIANDNMALPPCHWAFQVHSNGTDFDLIWSQRSVDSLLGLGFNASFYACLMLLLEKETGLKARTLIAHLGNVHIYENHFDQVNLQLSREPRNLPTITIPDEGWKSLFDWKYTDYVIDGYDPHPFIKAPVAI